MQDGNRIVFLEDIALLLAVLGVLIYEEPSSERLEILLEEGFFTDTPFSAEQYTGDAPEMSEGLDLLNEWSKQAAAAGLEATVSDLASEWARLLVGIGTPVAPPWASFYLERDSLLFSKSTLEVREWYARYGLELERKHREPDDHLGLMLQFLSMLVSRECDALKAEDTASATELMREQETFLNEFISPWISLWQQRVASDERSTFYRGLSLLIGGMLSLLASRFRAQDDALLE
ncbi:MAG: molecular chaperone TorD family protein [Coriobacteriia bacterium]|nr:molecular chaperone TorD family protein [Coriobacteriia bacterium]